jgi:hypothetical protein
MSQGTHKQALARELRAIFVLYLFIAILPILIGIAFGP